MKRSHVLLAIFLMLWGIVPAQKSFYSGALVISANFGTDGNIANQRYFSASEPQAQTLNGSATASDFNIGAEYGLFNWLGLGIISRVDNYYSQENQITQSTPSEGAMDIGGTANLHLLKWAHLDVLAGYDFGFSHLTYNTNNSIHTTSTANGTWSDIHATGRIYFGRLGINLCFYVPGTTYTNFKTSNMSLGDYTINYWKSTGYGASVGLQYRLL